MRNAIDEYDFHGMFTALHNFCAVDLSAFYFDIRKDRLYCDARRRSGGGARRARCWTACFDCLARWLAPILCFTAEEAWLARHGDAPGRSVHLELFPEVPANGATRRSAARWAELRDLRRVVTGALEVERAAKRIGSSLQAAVEIYRAREAAAAAARCRSRRAVHHLGRDGSGRAPPEGAFTLPDVAGGRGRGAPAAGDAVRALLAGVAGSRPCAGHDDLCRRCADVLDRGAAPRGGSRIDAAAGR